MIEIYNAGKYEELIRSSISATLAFFDILEKDIDLEIDFLSKEGIKELNKDFRQIDKVTDVLSFPNINLVFPFAKEDYKLDINPETGGVVLGEIYISFDKAVEQATQYNHSIERELAFLTIHGLLHLLSFDHPDDSSLEKMNTIQEDILSKMQLNRYPLNEQQKHPIATKKEDTFIFNGKEDESAVTEDINEPYLSDDKSEFLANAEENEPLFEGNEDEFVVTEDKNEPYLGDNKSEFLANAEENEPLFEGNEDEFLVTEDKNEPYLGDNKSEFLANAEENEPLFEGNEGEFLSSSEEDEPLFEGNEDAFVANDLDGKVVLEEDSQLFKCGYVAVLGRPNSGKSTLINHFVGHKVSIVTWKPQTTRNRILGIRNDVDSQIIFVDTPGIHRPKNELGKFMMRSMTSALNEVDVLIYIVNAEKDFHYVDRENIKKYLNAQKKVIVAVNKIDRVDPKKVAKFLTELSEYKELAAIVPISALRGKNTLPLLSEIKNIIPNAPPLYPDDIYTDRSMRFVVAEIIREKALKLLDEEIPYGVAIVINTYEEKEGPLIVIDASLIVQKSGHKGIVLGKNGAMIKKISTYARQDIENISQAKVFLNLWVRVEKDWRSDARALNELGYNKLDYL